MDEKHGRELTARRMDEMTFDTNFACWNSRTK